MQLPARTRRLLRRSAMGLFLIVLGAFAVGCTLFPETPMSTVHPTTEVTRMVQAIYASLTWWVVGIFVAVEATLLYAVIRFRRRPGQEGAPDQTHGNTPLEIGWTLLPLVPIIMVMVPTLQTTCALQAPTPSDNPLKVTVTGKQWWWKFEYPEYGFVTANELHLPKGRMVQLWLQSDNVIHSFWVPRLSGKRDLVPGRGQRLWFQPEQTGVYAGQCAELCGAQHANMRFKVFVQEPQEFQAWVEHQQAPAQTGMTDPGFTNFLGSGCIACHAIDFPGSPAQQQIGPNLTHVGSRTTIAAGILENTPENMRAWIHNVNDFKPGYVPAPNKMLTFDFLSDDQLDKLVSYLQGLD
jgi:cytochrome c oxidase subunit 2